MFKRFRTSALPVTCAAVLLLVMFRGLLDPLLCYDPWAYHLRFAASLWDISGSATLLNSSPRLEGFAIIANWFQGLVWWLFGSVNFVPLVNFVPFCVVLLLAKRWFSAHVSFMAFSLLAMPLIAIHVTSGYIDLFVGCMLVLHVMAAIRVLALLRDSPEQIQLLRWAAFIFFISGVMAANAKFQAVGVVVIVCFYTGYLLWRNTILKPFAYFNPWIALVGLLIGSVLAFYVKTSAIAIFWILAGYAAIFGALVCISLFAARPKHYNMLRILMLVCLLTSVFATATNVKNLIKHSNPLYPLEIEIGEDSVLFVGEEKSKGFLLGAHYPFWYRPFYFFISLTELDYLLHPLPKGSVYAEASQMALYRDTEYSNRSGGLFGAIIWSQLWLLIAGLWAISRHQRLAPVLRDVLNYFIVITFVSMWVKHGHELRYSLAWPIMLCFVNAMLMSHGLQALWPRLVKALPWLALGGLVLVQTVVPLQRTLWPSKIISYYPEAVKKRLNPQILEALRNKQFPCIYDVEQPYSYDYFGSCDVSLFAYASAFTKERYPFAFSFTGENCKPKPEEKSSPHQ